MYVVFIRIRQSLIEPLVLNEGCNFCLIQLILLELTHYYSLLTFILS